MSVSEPLPPPRSGTGTAFIAAGIVLLAFVTGFVAGMFAARIMVRRGMMMGGPPPFAARVIVRHLDRELHLTPSQRAQITSIVERRHERMRSVWASIHPQMRRELQEANAEIEQVLNPQQREKFEKMRMQLESRHERGMMHHGPGGPPPPDDE